MVARNNETPDAGRLLRVGLIADAADAAACAPAVRNCPALKLCGQAGMPQSSALPDVPWFDDTRVLIAQQELDAVLLATSPRDGVRLGELALEHGVHVWRPPPLGRDFAEAVELARRLRDSAAVYHVCSWWEHVGRQIEGALAAEECEPLFSEVRISAVGPPLSSWRSSQRDAGGGVLLCDGYFMLEALTALRGLPETVSAAVGRCRRQPGQAPRETEDVVSAALRYGGGGLAQLSATWDIRPFERATCHHGRQSSVRYDEQNIVLLAADGTVREQQQLPADFLTTDLLRFATAVAARRRGQTVHSTIERHLAVSALLEAIYLAARTGQPEIPRRLFEVQKWPEPRS